MAGRKADMVFTDPPWNVAIGQHSSPRWRKREGLANDDLSAEEFERFLDQAMAVLFTHCVGAFYIVMGSKQWPVIHRSFEDQGGHWSATIIWAKDVHVMGRSHYHRRYEPILYGWKTDGTHYWNGDRTQNDVWEFTRPRVSEEHPTMKPVGLVARAIQNSSRTGQLVLDTFLGSGTTLIAAEQLGRVCYRVEVEPRYCDVSVLRWETLTGQKAVRESL